MSGDATTSRITTNGVELSVTEAGDPDGPLIVLCHGFPELAHSWRHQVPALAAAGYHVLAPDQRGYGGSTIPAEVEDYDILQLGDDVLGLLDHAGEQQAVLVGHDWGAMVVWHLAQRAPERVRGVVGMSVPAVPRGPVAPVGVMRQLFGDAFFYMLYFQERDLPEADLGADPRRTLRGMLAGVADGASSDAAAAMFAPGDAGFVERLPQPESLPEWLTEDDLDEYAAAFERTGFFGPVSWYRNLDRNWELTSDLADRTIDVPALFITGAADPVVMMMPAAVMEGFVTDLRGSLVLDGAGHWVQQERPDEVNRALLEFLAGLDR